MNAPERHPLIGGPTLRTTWHGDTPVSIETTATVGDVVAIVAPNPNGRDDVVCIGTVTEVSDDGEALRASVLDAPDWTREQGRNSQVLIIRGVEAGPITDALRAAGGAFFGSLGDLRAVVREYVRSAR